MVHPSSSDGSLGTHCLSRLDTQTALQDGVDCWLLLVSVLVLVCRDVGYRGYWFFPWLESKSPADKQAVIDKTIKLMADGVMSPPVGA